MTQYFLDRFKEELKLKLSELTDSSREIEVIEAHPKTGAHFAVPLFAIAKELRQSPNELAKKLSDELKLSSAKKIEPAGGFLNIWLNPKALAEALSVDLDQNPAYGTWPDLNKGKAAVCDYPSPDIAKPLSVGHLRPALQGSSIEKLLKATGYKTISDSHLGDAGRSFGIRVVGFQIYSSNEKLKKNGIHELAELYVKIYADLKKEKELGGTKLNNEVQEWLKKLEAGDKEAVEFHKKFTEVSLEHMHEVLGRLDIETDLELGESFYIKRGHELVDKLLEEKVAKESRDAVVVDLKEFDIETPIMIRKSNGASLYAATDLATMEYRDKNFSPDKVFICAGGEQQFYFQQLEALRKKLGYNGQIHHVWWGLVNQTNDDGSISKMSSRKGVAYLEELLNMAEAFAKEKTEDREVNKEDIKKIAIGAIKFNDFAQDRKTNILFDWDRMFSLQGFSGPFVQYAGVRVKSILEKLNEEVDNQQELKSDYNFEKEADLLLKLSKYPELVKTSAGKYEPHHLATYAFELAKELNRYYEEVNIINSEDKEKEARIWLLKFTYKVLESSLEILGIQIPSKM
jgi:arginyl-tRNA synthetase